MLKTIEQARPARDITNLAEAIVISLMTTSSGLEPLFRSVPSALSAATRPRKVHNRPSETNSPGAIRAKPGPKPRSSRFRKFDGRTEFRRRSWPSRKSITVVSAYSSHAPTTARRALEPRVPFWIPALNRSKPSLNSPPSLNMLTSRVSQRMALKRLMARASVQATSRNRRMPKIAATRPGASSVTRSCARRRIQSRTRRPMFNIKPQNKDRVKRRFGSLAIRHPGKSARHPPHRQNGRKDGFIPPPAAARPTAVDKHPHVTVLIGVGENWDVPKPCRHYIIRYRADRRHNLSPIPYSDKSSVPAPSPLRRRTGHASANPFYALCPPAAPD